MDDSHIKHLSLRMDADSLAKFHYVCKANERTATGQLRTYMRNAIKKYEDENGTLKKADYAKYL